MTKHTLGDAPVEARYHRKMEAIARALDEEFNDGDTGGTKKIGFILMVFPFDHDGRCNYMSNARREDVVVLLKELIRRFEASQK